MSQEAWAMLEQEAAYVPFKREFHLTTLVVGFGGSSLNIWLHVCTNKTVHMLQELTSTR